MKISGLNEAVNRHMGHLQGAYSFVLDGANNEFIYVSEHLPIIEKSILGHHEKLNFSQKSDEANNNILQLKCDDLNRYLVVKKLATNIFFGISVVQESDKLQQALQAMSIDLRL